MSHSPLATEIHHIESVDRQQWRYSVLHRLPIRRCTAAGLVVTIATLVLACLVRTGSIALASQSVLEDNTTRLKSAEGPTHPDDDDECKSREECSGASEENHTDFRHDQSHSNPESQRILVAWSRERCLIPYGKEGGKKLYLGVWTCKSGDEVWFRQNFLMPEPGKPGPIRAEFGKIVGYDLCMAAPCREGWLIEFRNCSTETRSLYHGVDFTQNFTMHDHGEDGSFQLRPICPKAKELCVDLSEENMTMGHLAQTLACHDPDRKKQLRVDEVGQVFVRGLTQSNKEDLAHMSVESHGAGDECKVASISKVTFERSEPLVAKISKWTMNLFGLGGFGVVALSWPAWPALAKQGQFMAMLSSQANEIGLPEELRKFAHKFTRVDSLSKALKDLKNLMDNVTQVRSRRARRDGQIIRLLWDWVETNEKDSLQKFKEAESVSQIVLSFLFTLFVFVLVVLLRLRRFQVRRRVNTAGPGSAPANGGHPDDSTSTGHKGEAAETDAQKFDCSQGLCDMFKHIEVSTACPSSDEVSPSSGPAKSGKVSDIILPYMAVLRRLLSVSSDDDRLNVHLQPSQSGETESELEDVRPIDENSEPVMSCQEAAAYMLGRAVPAPGTEPEPFHTSRPLEPLECGWEKVEGWGHQTKWKFAVFAERNTGRTGDDMRTLRMLLQDRIGQWTPTDPISKDIQFVKRFQLSDFVPQNDEFVPWTPKDPTSKDIPKTKDVSPAQAKKKVVVQAGEEALTGEMVHRLDLCLNSMIRDIIGRGRGQRTPELYLEDDTMYLDVSDEESNNGHQSWTPLPSYHEMFIKRCCSPTSSSSSSSRVHIGAVLASADSKCSAVDSPRHVAPLHLELEVTTVDLGTGCTNNRPVPSLKEASEPDGSESVSTVGPSSGPATSGHPDDSTSSGHTGEVAETDAHEFDCSQGPGSSGDWSPVEQDTDSDIVQEPEEPAQTPEELLLPLSQYEVVDPMQLPFAWQLVERLIALSNAEGNNQDPVGGDVPRTPDPFD